jgi:hypothetical protein
MMKEKFTVAGNQKQDSIRMFHNYYLTSTTNLITDIEMTSAITTAVYLPPSAGFS